MMTTLTGHQFQLPACTVQTVVMLPRFTEAAALAGRQARIRARKEQYAAGRACAARLLARLGAPSTLVTSGADRAPVWPPGFVGSISHTERLLAVAVAPSERVSAIGIDLETIIADATCAELSAMCLVGDELRRIHDTCTNVNTLVTVFFSAKESFYKCLYPEVRTFFDFNEAEIDELDMDEGVLRIRLLRTLSPQRHAGATFQGRFRLDGSHVYTSFALGLGGGAAT